MSTYPLTKPSALSQKLPSPQKPVFSPLQPKQHHTTIYDLRKNLLYNYTTRLQIDGLTAIAHTKTTTPTATFIMLKSKC
jgi:hypothetical protein